MTEDTILASLYDLNKFSVDSEHKQGNDLTIIVYCRGEIELKIHVKNQLKIANWQKIIEEYDYDYYIWQESQRWISVKGDKQVKTIEDFLEEYFELPF